MSVVNTEKIQSLRGLACVLLVIYHVIGATEAQGLRVHDGWLRELTEALVAVRMPVFGLVAGAMYGLGSKGGWALVRNKAERLLLPMLTVGTVFALVQYFTPGSNYRINDWYLLHIVPVAHFWFLESLFLIFCGMALAERLWPANMPRRWLLYFGCSALVYLSHPAVVWFSTLGAAYLLPYFLVGMALTRFGWDAQQESRQSGLLRIALGACIVAWLLSQGTALDRFAGSTLVAGLLLSTGLWSLGLRHPWLEFVGNYSFAVYLFHVFFTSSVRMVVHALHSDNALLMLALSVPAGVLGPVLVQRLGQRWLVFRNYVLAMPAKRRPAT